jgi:hypothetical protein
MPVPAFVPTFSRGGPLEIDADELTDWREGHGTGGQFLSKTRPTWRPYAERPAGEKSGLWGEGNFWDA